MCERKKCIGVLFPKELEKLILKYVFPRTLSLLYWDLNDVHLEYLDHILIIDIIPRSFHSGGQQIFPTGTNFPRSKEIMFLIPDLARNGWPEMLVSEGTDTHHVCEFETCLPWKMEILVRFELDNNGILKVLARRGFC